MLTRVLVALAMISASAAAQPQLLFNPFFSSANTSRILALLDRFHIVEKINKALDESELANQAA